MKKKVAIILNSLAIVLVFACTIALSFAWYTNSNDIDVSLQGGSAGGYFRGGSGTATDPYEIANSRHMYNSAWLQNNGKCNSDDGPIYFELVNADGNNGVIDMGSIVIPPIGNDEYPFSGIFNGNGCSISNLVVSTNYDVIYNGDLLETEGYKFSNAVGLFGMTAIGSDIKNFILNDPIVEVYDGTKTNYYSAVDSSNAAVADNTAGLAIGYLNGSASYIGIKLGVLSNERENNYSSYNSIIGGISEESKEYLEMEESTITPTPTQGGDKGYFVPQAIIDNLSAKNQTTYNYGTYSTSAKTFTFAKDIILTPKNNSDGSLGELGLGAFSIITHNTKTTTLTNHNSNNSGKKIIFYDDYGSVSVSNAKTNICYGMGSTKYEIDLSVDEYTTSEANYERRNEILKNVVDKDLNRISSLDKVFHYGGSPTVGTATVTKVYEDNTTTTEVESHTFYPALKVKLMKTAKVFLVAEHTYSGTGNQYIGIYNREEKISKTSPAQALMLPGSTAKADKAYYACEMTIEVPETDTDGVEYYIGATANAPRIAYLSILGVQGGTSGSTPTPNPSSVTYLKTIDFIAEEVTLSVTNDSVSFSEGFILTQASISYDENMNDVVLYFVRTEDFSVYIYPKDDTKKPSNSGKTDSANIIGNEDSNNYGDVVIEKDTNGKVTITKGIY